MKEKNVQNKKLIDEILSFSKAEVNKVRKELIEKGGGNKTIADGFFIVTVEFVPDGIDIKYRLNRDVICKLLV